MVVLPLGLKYNKVMVNDLIEILLQEKDPLSYTDLYYKLTGKLKRNLSHRDFNNVLNMMMKEKLLVKDDNTGKRGYKVYYSLTEQSKKDNRLKILGRGEEFDRRRQIYHLLLYFDVFKRDILLTKRQLYKLLKKIGIDTNIIYSAYNINREHIQYINNLRGPFDAKVRFIGEANGVAIGEVEDVDINAKKNSKYYVMIPGFTKEEFISYIDNLRKHKDPRPFTEIIPLIPYVYYTRYSKDEIINSITLLNKAGLIRLINPVFHGEIRYKITEEAILGLFIHIRRIHQFQFWRITNKIFHMEKPNKKDKDFLTYFFGKRVLDAFIAYAYDSRRNFKEKYDNKKINEIKEKEKNLEKSLKILIHELNVKYGDVLITNEELLRGLFIQ